MHNTDSRDNDVTCPPEGPRIPRRRKAAYATCIVAAILALPEVACRLAGVRPSLQNADFTIRWALDADRYPLWLGEGPQYNSDGVRDREHAVDKPEGIARIHFLGDSVTMGFKLDRSNSFPFGFERYLDQLGARAEVFSVAVAGWSTRQQVAAYRQICRKYAPDQVLLCVCLNDITEIESLSAGPPPRLIAWLMRYSAFVSAVVDAEGRQLRAVQRLVRDPEAPEWAARLETFFSMVRELEQETQADGCELVLVLLPFRFQLDPAAPEPEIQRRIAAFCATRRVPCLDVLPALRRAEDEAFVDDSHLSFFGARAVAEKLAQWASADCSRCGFESRRSTDLKVPTP